MNKIVLLNPDEMINWGNPQVLPAGAKDILLYGNPQNNESYIFRFELPEHYNIEPFILTARCFLTVIYGEIFIGEGDTFIKNSMKILKAGGFCCIPDNSPIYLMSKEQTTIQFHGIGPIDLKYLNAMNDPRNKK